MRINIAIQSIVKLSLFTDTHDGEPLTQYRDNAANSEIVCCVGDDEFIVHSYIVPHIMPASSQCVDEYVRSRSVFITVYSHDSLTFFTGCCVDITSIA